MLLRSRVQLHGAVLLFGGAGLFAKLITWPAGSQVLGRTAIASAAMFFASIVLSASLRPQRRTDLCVFGLLGALLAAHWFAFFTSVQVSSVSIAAVTMATFPVFTALIKPLAFGRAPRLVDLSLALLALAGVAVIVGSGTLGSGPRGNVEQNLTHGVLWGIAAAVLFSLLAIANESMLPRYPAETVAFYQYTFAAALLAPFFGRPLLAIGVDGSRSDDWLLIVLLGTVFTALAHTLFVASMQRIRAETASLAVTLEPLYAVVLAWLVLDDVPPLGVVAGGAVILAAVCLGGRQPRNQS